MDSPTTNLRAWCSEITLPFGATADRRSEQIHPASTSIPYAKLHAEVKVVNDGFIERDSSSGTATSSCVTAQKKHSATEKGMDESIPFSTARTTEAILSAGASRSGHAPM
jgi:hypothetical protein